MKCKVGECPVEADQALGCFIDTNLWVSSLLQSLIKELALRTNIPKLSPFNGEMAKEMYHLNSGAMSCTPLGQLTVTLH